MLSRHTNYIIFNDKLNYGTNNKKINQENLAGLAKYARTGYIHRSYRAKDIINRFPNMKSIMYTNKHNKSTNNKSSITKNVDEKAKICPDGLYTSLVSR